MAGALKLRRILFLAGRWELPFRTSYRPFGPILGHRGFAETASLLRGHAENAFILRSLQSSNALPGVWTISMTSVNELGDLASPWVVPVPAIFMTKKEN